ncbi:MAG: BlaI/MecI/CopY family transcriptional regulator [Gemmatimonadaceae bacterium]|nr:BlaI/MecI/CopY family transcriptional regulator [Gemmatimonadaceae bacterium]
MSSLWRRGSATVAEVREDLDDELAYTSVLSALQTLTEKGYVRHEREGRAYRYFPALKAEAVGRTSLRRIRDAVFQGSAEKLVAQLLEDRDVSPEELRRLRALLAKRLEEGA